MTDVFQNGFLSQNHASRRKDVQVELLQGTLAATLGLLGTSVEQPLDDLQWLGRYIRFSRQIRRSE